MDDDPYLWLEDITSEQALDWVRQNSETTLAELSGARFERMRAEALEVADSSDRIPGVKRRGEYLYNFWTDAEHPRGLWRRTTLEEYCRDSPDWDVIIDIDALAAAEDENWVWAGADVIEPEYTRALISLSPGGSDAAVVREFDMAARKFVADGFNLPAARSDVSWEAENTVLVGTDFGEGSMSAAGFPLVVKRWRRGTPLDDAETVFTSPDGVMTPGTWQPEPIPGVPDNTDTGIAAIDHYTNEIFLLSSGFDKPPRLLYGHAGGSVREIKSSPARFGADDVVVSQHFATSLDGTRIPYFLVSHRDSARPRPTLLYGYGGFALSQLPGYLGVDGRLWLERGCTYVQANIRGGAEYGPGWYFQSIREGRHKVAEDFAAVAADLIDRGLTTARHLGAIGASAGGLLMGVMLTQYPELFGALVCRQPLLDMRRFPLLGGAAVIAE